MTTTYDAREAATVLREMDAFEPGLRRRTEGITWMVWALVFAGIAMSYYAGDVLAPPAPESTDARPWTLVLPWLPWVLAGGAATVAIWRSAALHAPELRRPWWMTLLALALIPIGMWALFIASWFAPAQVQELLTPPTLIGLVGLAVVPSRLLRLTPTGRRAGMAASAAQIVLGVALGLAPMPGEMVNLVTALVLGGTWLAAGLWETMQG